MAGAAASGVFNAFAFAGAGYVFKLIDPGGAQKEMKRHNAAMEKLTRERDMFNERRANELDRLNQLKYDKSEGLKDIIDTDREFANVESIFKNEEKEPEEKEKIDFRDKEIEEIEKRLRDMTRDKPKKEEYYKPSYKMGFYISLMKLALVTPGIYILMKLL